MTPELELRALSVRITTQRIAAAIDGGAPITPEARKALDEMKLLSASIGLQLHVLRTRQRFRNRTG